MISARTQKILDRFMKYVELAGECEVWTGFRDKKGYGRMIVGPEIRAHRVAYRLFRGPIPEGMVVRHRCDNRACVRSDHLELGTHADNVRDRDLRNRTARGLSITRAKLSDDNVRELRRLWFGSAMKQVEIAKKFNINHSSAYMIATGKRRGHVK